jgi:hypothetical protein
MAIYATTLDLFSNFSCISSRCGVKVRSPGYPTGWNSQLNKE